MCTPQATESAHSIATTPTYHPSNFPHHSNLQYQLTSLQLGTAVGGVSRTVGGVVGTAGRGVGQTINNTTGTKAVGDGLQGLTNGIEDGVAGVAKGVEDGSKGKKIW